MKSEHANAVRTRNAVAATALSRRGITNTLSDSATRNGQALLNPGGSAPRCETTCHCERRVIPSTWERIYNGVGETCGHPACIPPADA